MTPPPFDQLWFQLLSGFVIGICLGSFITMLSYRLPRRMSIVTPGSHCPSCTAQLTARDLVPVFSWLAMRGRCRHCGARIGARYVLIELAAGITSAVAFGWLGFQLGLIPTLLAIIAVITAIVIKFEG